MLAPTLPVEAAASGDASWVAARGKRRGAKKRRQRRPPVKEEAAPTPEPAPAAAVVAQPVEAAPVAPEPSATAAVEDLLKEATGLANALEYHRVVPIAEHVLKRDALAIEQRVEASLLLGSALAIMGDTVGAEKAFRFLLRANPDHDLPAKTSPKILGIFRKVQFEQKTIRDQLAELQRKHVIDALKLEGEPPTEATGGLPLEFSYRLRDKFGAVSTLDVHYRRRGEKNFSSLALEAGGDGSWQGSIGGEWTENDDGFMLEYYLTTADVGGDLLTSFGEANTPVGVQVAPGSVGDATPFYKAGWFWPVVGGAVVAIGASGYWAYRQASSLPDNPLGIQKVE